MVIVGNRLEIMLICIRLTVDFNVLQRAKEVKAARRGAVKSMILKLKLLVETTI
jgi:hypothetical protein